MGELTVDALRSRVAATGLLARESSPLLLLCSAGRDSATLLDLACEVHGVDGLAVLHIDHGLRPESAQEAELVAEWGRARGISVEVRRLGGGAGVPAGGAGSVDEDSSGGGGAGSVDEDSSGGGGAGSVDDDSSGAEGAAGGVAGPVGNVQAWARAERYRVAAEVAATLGARRVATAHTQTDLVEGVLFRLATQPGSRALRGMPSRTPLAGLAGEVGGADAGGAGVAGGGADRAVGAAALGGRGDGVVGAAEAGGRGVGVVGVAEAGGRGVGVELVRPMLGVSRPEVLAYASARGLVWREDPSNADARFARARLRTSVLPVLRALNPQADEAIARTALELTAEQDALAAIVSAAIPPAPAGEIAVDALAAVPRPVARLVLREVCERWSGAPCPRVLVHADALIDRALASRDPFSLDIGAGLRLSVRQGTVRCEPSTGPAAPH